MFESFIRQVAPLYYTLSMNIKLIGAFAKKTIR